MLITANAVYSVLAVLFKENRTVLTCLTNVLLEEIGKFWNFIEMSQISEHGVFGSHTVSYK